MKIKIAAWYCMMGVMPAIPVRAAALPPPAGIDSLIEQVMGNYRKLQTLQCKVIQIRSDGSDTTELTGQLYFRAPDSLKLHYLAPVEQVVLLDTKKFVQFSREGKQAVVLMRDSLNRIEQELVKKVSFVKMDHFDEMRDGYTFSYHTTWPDGLVLSAVPRTGWKRLSLILIKVDPDHKVYRALELFDKDKKLIYQIRYSDFVLSGDVWYPTEIAISLIAGEQLITDTIHLTRLKINQGLRPGDLTFAIPAGTSIQERLAP